VRGGIYSPMDEMAVGAFSCAIVGRPLKVGRPNSNCRTFDMCRMSKIFLMNTVRYARLVASDADIGRPAGFGRPTCRTSEGRRTSVRFGRPTDLVRHNV